MAWGALAASSGCVRRALIGLPSESRTGPLLSDAAAGARGAAGGGACLAAPGDRTPARDICRPQGSCDGLRSMLLAHSLCFRVARRPAPEASLRAPRVLNGWRGRLRGARAARRNPKTKSKPDGAFSAGRVGWGGAGPWRGRKHLGSGCDGTRRCNPFYWQKQKKAKRRALKAAFYRARRRPRATTPAQCCAACRLRQPCAGTRAREPREPRALDALSSQFAQRAAPTPPQRPRRAANNNPIKQTPAPQPWRRAPSARTLKGETTPPTHEKGSAPRPRPKPLAAGPPRRRARR